MIQNVEILASSSEPYAGPYPDHLPHPHPTHQTRIIEIFINIVFFTNFSILLMFILFINQHTTLMLFTSILVSSLLSIITKSFRPSFWILSFLLSIAVIRAILIKSSMQSQNKQIFSHPSSIAALKQMIQHQTTKQMIDNDQSIIDNYVATLKHFFPNIFQYMSVRLKSRSILFEFKGITKQKPFLLMNHSDVVDVIAGEWTQQPFGGEVIDNKIYGRGTFDTKGGLCAILQAVDDLLAQNKCQRQFFILSSFDEETDRTGCQEVVQHLKSIGTELDFVLDEGGAVVDPKFPSLKSKQAIIAIAEKGFGTIKFTARSKGGHSSQPPKKNPMLQLAKLIVKLDSVFPMKMHKITKLTLKTVAPYQSFICRLIFGNIWLFERLIVWIFSKSDTTRPTLQTTCAFTVAEAGQEFNVIPTEASVTACVRFSLHQNQEEQIAIIKKVAERYSVETEILKAYHSTKVSSIDSQNYKNITTVINNVFPGVVVTPYFAVGATDSVYLCEICDQIYRFVPLDVTDKQLHSMHGKDENIDIQAEYNAVEFYSQLIMMSQ